MKRKVCPSCQHQNQSYVSSCEKCNKELTGVPTIEVSDLSVASGSATSASQRDNSPFCMLLWVLSWVYLVSGAASGVYIGMKLDSIEIAIGLFMSGLVLYAILNGIMRILEK